MEQVDPRDLRIAELESQVRILTELVEKLLVENAALRAENVALRAENVALRAENAELKARLGMNSSNSSKPPSSDPPGKTPSPKKNKIKGRKSGGQRGHKRHIRELVPVVLTPPIN